MRKLLRKWLGVDDYSITRLIVKVNEDEKFKYDYTLHEVFATNIRSEEFITLVVKKIKDVQL